MSNSINNFKCQALATRLQEKLQGSLSTSATFSTTYDGNGAPTLKVVNASETIYITIASEPDASRVDSVGAPQTSYAPTDVFVLEDSTPVDLNTRYITHDAAAWLGTKLYIYEIHPVAPPTPTNNTTQPFNYAPSGATLVSAIYPDPYNALTNQI
jgi:hypothetical protein